MGVVEDSLGLDEGLEGVVVVAVVVIVEVGMEDDSLEPQQVMNGGELERVRLVEVVDEVRGLVFVMNGWVGIEVVVVMIAVEEVVGGVFVMLANCILMAEDDFEEYWSVGEIEERPGLEVMSEIAAVVVIVVELVADARECKVVEDGVQGVEEVTV